MVPIGWRLAPAEVSYILKDTKATLLFTDNDCETVAQGLKTELGSVRRVICIDQTNEGCGLQAFLDKASDSVPPQFDASEDVFPSTLYVRGRQDIRKA